MRNFSQPKSKKRSGPKGRSFPISLDQGNRLITLPPRQYKIPMFWITYMFFAHLFRQPQPIVWERTNGLNMPTKLDLLEELGRAISQKNIEWIGININRLIATVPHPTSVPLLKPGEILPSIAKREQIRDIMEITRLLPPEKVDAIYHFTQIIGHPKFQFPSDKSKDFVGWLYSAIHAYCSEK